MTKETCSIGSLHLNESLARTGGAEIYVSNLAKSLQEHNVPVFLVSSRIETLELPKISYILPKLNTEKDIHNIGKNVTKIKQIMEDNNLTIIHFHSINRPELYYELASLFPMVRTIHDSRIVCPTEFRINRSGDICSISLGNNCLDCSNDSSDTIKENKNLLKALNTLKTLIVPSQYIKNQLVLNGISENKINIISPFVSLDVKHISKIDSNYVSDVLFMGRIIRSKGLREAIQSFAKIDRFNFVVCGDGPDSDTCKTMASDLGVRDRVRFTGWVNNEEKWKYLSGTKVVIMPSMGPESFGLVGLESMFFKKPIIAFNSGGIVQWMKNGVNGYLIERGNINQMAENLNKMLTSNSLRDELGINGKNILDSEFSQEKHISKITELYSRL